MTTTTNDAPVATTDVPTAAADRGAVLPNYPRLWPAIVIVAAYWLLLAVWRVAELGTFIRFVSGLAAAFAVTVAFVIWWVRAEGFGAGERLGALAALFVGGASAVPLSVKTWGPLAMLPTALPWVFTTWVAWLLIAGQRLRPGERLAGLVVTILLTWSYFTVTRLDGVSGEQRVAVSWRWTPTAEERFLAESGRTRTPMLDTTGTPSREPAPPLVAGPGDCPTFRGPREDASFPGVTFATDWDANPPKLLWKQRVGPGWSSVIVVGDRLFTQEQRGASEAVVCLDANTGRQNWLHLDTARFEESVAGAGPRATPTFADGRVYTLGATGILNCFDASGGSHLWTRNIAQDNDAKLPNWGFSSSPLVVSGHVIVYAGGSGDRGLVAYRAADSAFAWSAPAGASSYASAQRATIAGVEQALFISETGVISVDPASGKNLWRHDANAPGAPRAVQPVVVGDNNVLVAWEGTGLATLNVTRSADDAWAASQAWTSRGIEPSFSSFVVHDGFAYGFDGSYLCCAELAADGKRRWKSPFYGRGQVVLLPDLGLLLVLSEDGEAVLVRASAARHQEVGRFAAIDGKTWNHPVIAGNRLYVRNAEEMACYELANP